MTNIKARLAALKKKAKTGNKVIGVIDKTNTGDGLVHLHDGKDTVMTEAEFERLFGNDDNVLLLIIHGADQTEEGTELKRLTGVSVGDL